MVALKRSGVTGLLAVLLLFGLLLGSLLIMSDATQNSDRFGRLHSVLLLFNAVGLLVLTGISGYQLYRLIAQYRARVAGARLTLRLVALFVVLAVVPVSVVYYFSVQFLQKGIDSWFDVRIEQALEDALDLSRASLDLRIRETLRQTQRMASQMENVSPGLATLSLTELRETFGADELILMEGAGRIVATASGDAAIVPDLPDDVILEHVSEGQTHVTLAPDKDAGLQIRVVVPISEGSTVLTEQRVLQALFPVSERFNSLAESVEAAYDSYRQLAFLRGPLKTSFIITLSLVLAVSLLTALWTAVQSARRLVAPVRDLAEGTVAVSKGRYDQRLPIPSNDELGFLVMSFNQMTRNLAYARDQATRSQRLLERQRAYLETVLSSLSSGVLTLRQDGRLRTANTAAGQILGAVRDELLDRRPRDVAATRPNLEPFCELIETNLRRDRDGWAEQVTLFGAGGRQVLMCRGSSLTDDRGLTGHVVVFDDITTLVQAQRNAAWGEVARRMAHEIKNPLTPIQLAAERIRHKYLGHVGEDEGRVLDRATHTIVQQVMALKEMVDAFNEYARSPTLKLTPLDLNALISEVTFLYRDHPSKVTVNVDADPSAPVVTADSVRIRQLLHNLIKNAIEALEGRQDGGVMVRTRRQDYEGNPRVEIMIEDNGPGFPSRSATDIFEPYVTTKTKGTGLGLAIVKKIVEEHGGMIRAEAVSTGGARILIHLPYSDPERTTAEPLISEPTPPSETLVGD
jgi:PAS domain S-box-containing protein